MPLDALPWKVLVRVAEIPDAGLHRKLEASSADLSAIAAIADLRSLSTLKGEFDLKATTGGRVIVTGRVQAKVEQTCVVTLDPVETTVDEDVDAVYAELPDDAPPVRGPHDPDDETAEPPERIINGTIDLGALATEFMILGLDPYPRKPGVSFEASVEPDDPEDHPFAALSALKKPQSPKKPKKSNGK